MSNVPYILGHSDAELRRLMLQPAILKPITRRLMLEAPEVLAQLMGGNAVPFSAQSGKLFGTAAR